VDSTRIGAVILELRGLDLNPDESAVVLEDEVVLRGVSPGLGDTEVVFGGCGHKAQLYPLTPAFWLSDFHCKFVHGLPNYGW